MSFMPYDMTVEQMERCGQGFPRKRYRWVQVPVCEPLNMANLYEHKPLNPYRSEYPRFLSKPHSPRLTVRWERRLDESKESKQ